MALLVMVGVGRAGVHHQARERDAWIAASIFFYMMLGGLLLVPLALAMTDFSQPINYSFDGVGPRGGHSDRSTRSAR